MPAPKAIIDSINEQLISDEEIKLWWHQGYSNYMVNKNIEKIADRTWVIDDIEMTIEKVWLYICPNSSDRDYILVKTEASPDFPIYPEYNGERDIEMSIDMYLVALQVFLRVSI